LERNKSVSPSIIIELTQLKAIEESLTGTYTAFERRVRRWFSQTLSTPYQETFNLPWEDILLHYYESGMEGKSHNEIMSIAIRNYLPELQKEATQNDEKLDQKLVDQQKRQQDEIKQTKRKEAKIKKKLNQEVNESDKEQSLKSKELSTQPKPKSMSMKFDDGDDQV
jgi:primosomal protein N'